MTKIGILRCAENSERCAGWNCFPAMAKKTGTFDKYDTIELVGFDTCGGCGHGRPDKILKQAKRLIKQGAEVIHLGNCMAYDCPSIGVYRKALKRARINFVERTHPSASPEQQAAFRAAIEAKKAKRVAAGKKVWAARQAKAKKNK